MLKEFTKRLISSIILIPFSLLIIVKGNVFFIIFITIIFIKSFYEWSRMVKDIYIEFIGITFLFYSFTSAYLLRNNIGEDYGAFLFIVSICILTDIGGYFFGKLFGGPKLTKISPNKTISGMIGSFCFSALLFPFYLKLNLSFYLDDNNYKVFIFIILISLVSQIGDIIISYFKRLYKVKDTGNIIPGHGGLLDRIDGMIFAIPFAYLFLKLNLLLSI